VNRRRWRINRNCRVDACECTLNPIVRKMRGAFESAVKGRLVVPCGDEYTPNGQGCKGGLEWQFSSSTANPTCNGGSCNMRSGSRSWDFVSSDASSRYMSRVFSTSFVATKTVSERNETLLAFALTVATSFPVVQSKMKIWQGTSGPPSMMTVRRLPMAKSMCRSEGSMSSAEDTKVMSYSRSCGILA